MKTLVTGCAGFIGSHLVDKLLEQGYEVIGMDCFTDYYHREIKEKNISNALKNNNFKLIEEDIMNMDNFPEVDYVFHLAAQAGVRHSLENPFIYEKVNGMGTLNIFEMAREHPVENLVYASSSSVYGGNTKMPFKESDATENPLSLYASTKRANELTSNVYSKLYNIPMTGLRFFTVYGPWGRPDMALFLFTNNISKGLPIDVYNFGKMQRNFTYIDDIVAGVVASIDTPFENEIFNLGGSETVELSRFIEIIESELGKKATQNMLPLQPGDVPITYADTNHATFKLGYRPKTHIREGIKNFIEWYRGYYER